MTDYLVSVWSWEIQIIQVMLAMATIYLPTLVRRATHVEYVPLYFSAYPLRAVNDQLYEVYALQYLKDTLPESTEFNAARHQEYHRFRRKAWASYFIDALGIPLGAGVVIAILLSKADFVDFLVVLLLVKLVELGRSLYEFNRNHRDRQGILLVAASYAVYLVLLLVSVRIGYNWMRPFSESGDYVEAVDTALSTAFQELLLPAVLTLGIAYFVIERLAATNIRSEQE